MPGSGWRDRRLLDLFGIEIPIVQAPMAGSGGADLAAEVIAAGALGSLPCALLAPERIRADIGIVRQRATGPVNLNFFCHVLPESDEDSAWRGVLAPYYAEYGAGPPAEPPPLRRPFSDAMCELVEEVRPEVVSFHFGLPDDRLLDRVRAAGAHILASATSIAEARWLAGRGCDAIIAQGWEAGGHAGRFLPADPASHMGLIALVPQIVDAVDIPVIAAGGIADARGIAAALLLGASAVQIGTAYLRSPESLAPPAHRAALEGEGAERTVFTNVFTGRLARGLPNRLIEEVGPVSAAALPFPYASNALADLRKAAEAKGDMGFTSFWSGQVARLGPALPARELTRRLAAETLALMG